MGGLRKPCEPTVDLGSANQHVDPPGCSGVKVCQGTCGRNRFARLFACASTWKRTFERTYVQVSHYISSVMGFWEDSSHFTSLLTRSVILAEVWLLDTLLFYWGCN